jgi:hypothetical protein
MFQIKLVMDEKPKQRSIVLDIAVLAYLGDYITMVEKGVKQIAQEDLDKLQQEKKKKRY